ncbi:hypothetical protein PQR11_21465 [Paraburkholderia strydomiana]|uniref:hypothetical protein n=1 Tax=Paraburkholderia strydomiana TaxID=1245417 RepID=UPI0038BCA7CE
MSFVAIIFAGAFLCNAMPHLTAGLRGEVFPSPFSTPHGKGPSSPLVHHPFAPGVNVDSAALLVGVLVMGAFTSVHFGRVRHEGLF